MQCWKGLQHIQQDIPLFQISIWSAQCNVQMFNIEFEKSEQNRKKCGPDLNPKLSIYLWIINR